MTMLDEPVTASPMDRAVQVAGLEGVFLGEILDRAQIEKVIDAAEKQGTTPRAAVREAINAWLGVG
jgi:hypothetical protein